MNYRALGIVSLIVGTFQSILSSTILFSVIPRLGNLYLDFVQQTPNIMLISVLPVVLLIAGMTNLWFSTQLFMNKNRQHFAKPAQVTLLVSALLFVLFIPITIISIILPIYRLTSQF